MLSKRDQLQSYEKLSYRPDEVAQRWDISARTIMRLIADGILPAFKRGNTTRIKKEAIELFEAANRTGVMPKRMEKFPIAKNKPEKSFDYLLENLGNPSKSLNGDEFLNYRLPMVYVWVRNATVLYIGKSQHGFARPFGSHDVLKEVRSGDEIHFWRFTTSQEAEIKERELIFAIRPVYNSLRI